MNALLNRLIKLYVALWAEYQHGLKVWYEQSPWAKIIGDKLKGLKGLKFVGIGVVAVGLFCFALTGSKGVDMPRLLNDLEMKTYDLRVSLTNPLPERTQAGANIAIIKFDDDTLSNLEEDYGAWPWPRQVHADIIRFLYSVGTRASVYDMMFVGRNKAMSSGDKALIAAFKETPNAYISMNFDHNQVASQLLNKGLKTEERQAIYPLRIPLKNELPAGEHSPLQLDGQGFYSNDSMTFDHFRPIMPELLAVGKRIGFINHSRDEDGMSRSNPLFFRFIEKLPDGKAVQTFYPYLSFQLFLDQIRKQHKLAPDAIRLTPTGELMVGEQRIPLSFNGSFMIHWYNTNVELPGLEAQLYQLQQVYKQSYPKFSQTDRAILLHQIAQFQEQINSISRDARPYPEIPAWRIIRAIRDKANGKWDKADEGLVKFLKDKVVFIGTTAVSTYDIKTTPVNRMLPGVLLQAIIFDNLMQNSHYIHRPNVWVSEAITVFLCLMIGWSVLRMRSALAGLLSVISLVVSYAMFTLLLFKQTGLWLNVAIPVLGMVSMTLVTYIVKYMSRDRDYQKTYTLATTDGLTGLYNHRYFQETMSKCLENANRTAGPFSLILIDIDFFKKFNDNFGHQAGDEVLRQVARKLQECVRSNDTVARYGGEEMAIVLHRTSNEEAMKIARSVVQAIAEESYEISAGVQRHVTISAGVATFPLDGVTVPQLIEVADQGLYYAKEHGRNQLGLPPRLQKPETLSAKLAAH